MSRRTVVLIAALTPAALFLGAGAFAAPAPPPSNAPAVQAVMDCRKFADNTQRLACFDAAAAALSQAEASGDLVSLDRSQRREVRRQAFGLTLPSIALFDRGEGDLDAVKETLASARQGEEGRWIFVMQDGQVWRQIDDEFLSRKPHEGSAIEIRRAMLGSFMLSVDGQPGVRAHRDN
jgi:hypothetical protein